MIFGKKRCTKKAELIEKTKLIVDRQKMLNEEPRYPSGYYADYEMCQFCYEYLKKAFAGVDSRRTDIEIGAKGLSERNLACLKSAFFAFRENDSDAYWHEVSDFIHNYGSKDPVSYPEHQVFSELFELGSQLMGDEAKTPETEV